MIDPETAPRNYRARALEAARVRYAEDEVAIDDDAKLSEADEGTWVSAWVWVNDNEMEDD
jgi:hypothetical protein